MKNLASRKPFVIRTLGISCFVSAYFYVVFFYLMTNKDWDTVWWSLGHATIGAFLTINLITKLQKRFNENRFSVAVLLLIISIVYFQLSSIKYTEYSLYDGFITNLGLRFIGSCLGALALYFSTELWFRLKIIPRKDDSFLQDTVKHFRLPLSLLLSIIFLLMYSSVTEYLENPLSFYLREQYVETNTIVLLQGILNKVALSLLLCAVVFYIRKKRNWIPAILFISIYVFQSVVSGNRSTLLYPLVGLIGGLITLKGISMRVVYRAIIIGPVFILLFSLLVFTVSGRETTADMDRMAWQIAYRFDLTDFPMTLLYNNRENTFQFESIKDALALSIPKVLSPGKWEVRGTTKYQDYLESSGLSPYTDYNDSYFSMGVEVGKFFGFLLILPLVIVAVELYDAFLSRFDSFGTVLKIITFYIYTRIEYEWILLFLDIRHLPIYIIGGTLFYLIAFRKRNFTESVKGFL